MKKFLLLTCLITFSIYSSVERLKDYLKKNVIIADGSAERLQEHLKDLTIHAGIYGGLTFTAAAIAAREVMVPKPSLITKFSINATLLGSYVAIAMQPSSYSIAFGNGSYGPIQNLALHSISDLTLVSLGTSYVAMKPQYTKYFNDLTIKNSMRFGQGFFPLMIGIRLATNWLGNKLTPQQKPL